MVAIEVVRSGWILGVFSCLIIFKWTQSKTKILWAGVHPSDRCVSASHSNLQPACSWLGSLDSYKLLWGDTETGRLCRHRHCLDVLLSNTMPLCTKISKCNCLCANIHLFPPHSSFRCIFHPFSVEGILWIFRKRQPATLTLNCFNSTRSMVNLTFNEASQWELKLTGRHPVVSLTRPSLSLLTKRAPTLGPGAGRRHPGFTPAPSH